MKVLKSLFALVFSASLILGVTSCSESGSGGSDWGNTSQYTLTFNGNGGTYGASSTKNVHVSKNRAYSLSSDSSGFSYSGYTLLGWSKTKKTPSSALSVSDCDYTTADSVAISTDTTLYAVWKPSSSAQITLKFWANGGKYDGIISLGVLPDATAEVIEGEYYDVTSTSAKFTRNGYTLLGWANTRSATEATLAYNGKTVFSSENGRIINLYAVWKAEETSAKITVKLYGNGGKYNGSTTSSLFAAATLEAEVGKTYSLATESAKFTYTGYTLLGWSRTQKTPSSSLTESDCDVTASGSTTFTGNDGDEVKLYAVWKSDMGSDLSSGTILNNTVSVPQASYVYSGFTLDRSATVTVSMSCSGEMDYYLVTSDNFTKFKNSQTFYYYSAVSADDVKTVSGSVTLAAGTYYYICKNENIFNSKEVTRRITYTYR